MADSNFREPSFTALGTALAQLPLEAPEASAWPMLAARIARPASSTGTEHSPWERLQARRSSAKNAQNQNQRQRWPFAAALAASLLALALLPRGISHAPDTTSVDTGNLSASQGSLHQLMAESLRLESLVSASDSGTSSASAAVLGLELEDRLQQLDGQLAAANISDGERQALWQQRVALLRDYAGFESTRRWYAAEGRSLDVALVAAY